MFTTNNIIINNSNATSIKKGFSSILVILLSIRPDLKSLIYLAIQDYSNFGDSLSSHRGLANTVKILKDINSRYKHLALKRKFSRKDNLFGNTLLRVNSKGQISRLSNINKLLIAWPFGALTITNYVYGLKLSPTIDLSSIITPGDFINFPKDEFSLWCENNLKKVDVEFNNKYLHVSVKAGPLGPAATLQAGKDAVALMESELKVIENLNITQNTINAAESLLEDSKSINFEKLTEKFSKIYNNIKSMSRDDLYKSLSLKIDDLSNKINYPLSRLSFIAAPAGKTRIVFILNYWAQELLKPLHDAAFKILESYKSDGTFRQEELANQIKEISDTEKGSELHSFDLTNATDRWPRDLQYLVMKAHFGDKWAKIWYKWMCVPPVLSGLKPYKYVEYAVGQPMGAYASWAALALSHHALIRYLASKLGVNGTRFIIGDDITLVGSKISNSYLDSLQQMGVSISKAKSVIPNGTKDYAAEFAKHLILNGKDLTPLSPNTLNEVFKFHQWWKLVDLVDVLEEKLDRPLYQTTSDGTVLLSRLLSTLMARFNKTEQFKFLILLLNFERRETSFRGCHLSDKEIHCVDINPWFNSVRDEDTAKLLAYYINDELAIRELIDTGEKLYKLKSSINQLAGSEIKLPGLLLNLPGHPIWDVFESLEETLKNCYDTIVFDQYSEESATQAIVDVEYLEELISSGKPFNEWRSKKERRIRHDIKCVMTVHNMFLGKIPVVEDVFVNGVDDDTLMKKLIECRSNAWKRGNFRKE